MLRLKPLLKQLTIKTSDGNFRPLDLDYVDPDPEIGDWGWAQREFVGEIERQYNAGKPVRIITLKARQLGISTATEGVIFTWEFLHPATNGLVVTHETQASTELFEMTKLYWETWPYRPLYSLKYQTKQNLHWEETRSRLRIATAKNVQGGRGSTVQALHASEVAFWPDPRTLWTGLSQTIPHRHGTIVVLESTANGVGNWFHEEWLKAEEGDSDFIPLFFPWYNHPAYRMMTTLTIRSELDSYETELLRLGATMENIAWRRWAIKNKVNGSIDDFMQEYPSTPEEAFITSGQPIFSAEHLRDCFREEPGIRGLFLDLPNGSVKFVPSESGGWTLFRSPRRGDQRSDRYFCSGDPSESIAGDPACIQVINRKTFEQVAVWHGRTNPIHFGYEMMRGAKYYNGCMVCPEVEGGGQATIATILNSGYPNVWLDKRADRYKGSFSVYGWSTNWQRKAWAIGTLQRLTVDGSIILHDRKTYNQMRGYVQRDNGEWGNADAETHDDSVMALSIAVTGSITEGPFAEEDVNDNVIADLFNQELEGGQLIENLYA